MIDYFLATVVFPKHMREFPKKLSASGWDLASVKQHLTTGFSGTADSKHVLPLGIAHLDLPDQRHTDALVLSYLLRPENSIVSLPSHQRIDESTAFVADELLQLVVDQGDTRLRVILDVGAQVLELTNRQVAAKWLAMERQRDSPTIEAAVYFDDSEEVMVLDYGGSAEPLRVSQYMDQLDLCVVFLDEAHTRGTDLPLPANYRAAVTLGAKLTKDRLMQGMGPLLSFFYFVFIVFIVFFFFFFSIARKTVLTQ